MIIILIIISLIIIVIVFIIINQLPCTCFIALTTLPLIFFLFRPLFQNNMVPVRAETSHGSQWVTLPLSPHLTVLLIQSSPLLVVNFTIFPTKQSSFDLAHHQLPILLIFS